MTALLARELGVLGAVEFSPAVHADDRGQFVTQMHEADVAAALGRPIFAVRQASHSRSRRGVVRGVHFTAGPGGTEKYVHCPRGRVLDMVVDLRLGSPTFGRVDSAVLDEVDCRALYLPAGVGHAFVALEDDTVMSYLMSATYTADRECAVSVFDPELALPIPADIEPVLSERDRQAGTVAAAAAAGLLPRYLSPLSEEADPA